MLRFEDVDHEAGHGGRGAAGITDDNKVRDSLGHALDPGVCDQYERVDLGLDVGVPRLAPAPDPRSSTACRSWESRGRGASCHPTLVTSSRASGPRPTSPWRWGSASPPPGWSRAWRT